MLTANAHNKNQISGIFRVKGFAYFRPVDVTDVRSAANAGTIL